MTKPSPPVTCYALNVSKAFHLPSRQPPTEDHFLLIGPDHAPLLEKVTDFTGRYFGGAPIVLSFAGPEAIRSKDDLKARLIERRAADDHCHRVLVLCHLEQAPADVSSTVSSLLRIGMAPTTMGSALLNFQDYHVFLTVEGHSGEAVPRFVRERVLWPVTFCSPGHDSAALQDAA